MLLSLTQPGKINSLKSLVDKTILTEKFRQQDHIPVTLVTVSSNQVSLYQVLGTPPLPTFQHAHQLYIVFFKLLFCLCICLLFSHYWRYKFVSFEHLRKSIRLVGRKNLIITTSLLMRCRWICVRAHLKGQRHLKRLLKKREKGWSV